MIKPIFLPLSQWIFIGLFLRMGWELYVPITTVANEIVKWLAS